MSEFRTDWIAEHLGRAPRVVLDVGSYNGMDAVRIKQAYPAARVIAIEADPNNYRHMMDDGACLRHGVEVFQLAVTDQTDVKELTFHPNTDERKWNKVGNCSGSILPSTPLLHERYPFIHFVEPVNVPASRLDAFCRALGIEDEVDVIHMDVQGAEGFAIRGLGAMRPALMFFETDATGEYAGAIPLAELRRMMEERGYTRQWSGQHDDLWILLPESKRPGVLAGLTVAITSFHRPALLDRAIESVKAAGLRRVVVATSEPDQPVEQVLAKWAASGAFTSFDVARVKTDIGCNNTWILGAYYSRTNRLIILHDDDVLLPGLADVYRELIAPALDAGAGYASWRAEVLLDNGRTGKNEYFSGPTRLVDSAELLRLLPTRLTHSPVISVFDRTTVIRACKEAAQTLVENDSLERPGQLLGTELLVYWRHAKRFQQWLYIDRVLSRYGCQPDSGTIRAQRERRIDELKRGYALARAQGEREPPPPAPKILFIYSALPNIDDAASKREALVRPSWDFQFGSFSMIERPVTVTDLMRSSANLKDDPNHVVPYVRDLFDLGFSMALPEDVIVYCNRDIGLTTSAADRLLEGVKRGRGVTCCDRRMLHPKPGQLYQSVANCKTDMGFDLFACSPEWWREHRLMMPDMFIGREIWDTCFRVLAEEWADRRTTGPFFCTKREEWAKSRAYTEDVCFHPPHDSYWWSVRLTNPAQRHNRALARAFFEARHQQTVLRILDRPDDKVEGVTPVNLPTFFRPPNKRIIVTVNDFRVNRVGQLEVHQP